VLNIVAKSSPNYSPRYGEKPVAVVIHIMAGSLDSTTGWFANPSSGVSSHYGVGKDGRVFQFVKEYYAAWTNGDTNKPDMSVAWIAQTVKDNDSFCSKYSYGVANARTITIENEGQTGEVLTPIHWSTLVRLVADICKKNNIPVDRQHINGHYQINSVTRPNCPGKGIDLDKLVKEVQAMDKNYLVGEGILAAMTAHNDTPASDELYYTPNSGAKGSQISFATGKSGNIYVAYEAEQWKVRVFNPS
jgi:N-acetylmuramoyl-L-alanine amidase